MVGADAGGLVGCGGLGVVGMLDSGNLGLLRLLGVMLGLLGACSGVVGLLAVGACVVPLGLGVPAALDFFGKPGLGGGNALVGAGPGGVHLGLGRFDVAYGAQLSDGAGEGVGVLAGDLLQGADKLGCAGQAERDGLSTGFLDALPAGLSIPPAPLAVGGQRVVVRVVAVLGLRAAVAATRGGGLIAAGVRAVLGVVVAAMAQIGKKHEMMNTSYLSSLGYEHDDVRL